jgi:hypothetical protein
MNSPLTTGTLVRAHWRRPAAPRVPAHERTRFARSLWNAETKNGQKTMKPTTPARITPRLSSRPYSRWLRLSHSYHTRALPADSVLRWGRLRRKRRRSAGPAGGTDLSEARHRGHRALVRPPPAAIVARLNYLLSYATFNGMQIRTCRRSTEPAWVAQSGAPPAASAPGREYVMILHILGLSRLYWRWEGPYSALINQFHDSAYSTPPPAVQPNWVLDADPARVGPAPESSIDCARLMLLTAKSAARGLDVVRTRQYTAAKCLSDFASPATRARYAVRIRTSGKNSQTLHRIKEAVPWLRQYSE